MVVLIGIVLFLVLGVIIVLVARDSDQKIRDLAGIAYKTNGVVVGLTATVHGDGKNVGLKGAVEDLQRKIEGLTDLSKKVTDLEAGKANTKDVKSDISFAINSAKGELIKEIAGKADVNAVKSLEAAFRLLEDKVAGVVQTLAAAAKEARHRAGIFETHELVAKELKISEDDAQLLINCVENDPEFGVTALKVGVRLADIGAAQQKIREIITKAQGEVEAKEKTA